MRELIFLLSNMTFLTDPKFLTDPYVWVPDTGATVHSSPHLIGMHEVKEATKENDIVVND